MFLGIKNFLLQGIRFFLGPQFCLFCHQAIQQSIFCDSCSVKTQKRAPIDISIAGKTIAIHAFAGYQDPFRKIILSKHHHDIAVLDRAFEYVVQQDEVLQHMNIDYVVPVPLHWTRYAQRGFNQSEVLAQKISQCFQKTVLHCVKRHTATKYQFKLSAHDRKLNVQNVFSVPHNMIKKITGKHILLVDDLYTTGSTVESICKVLMKYKPASIKVFVVCRAI